VLAESLAALGFVLRRTVLYRVDAADNLPLEAATALRQGAVDVALFYSSRSARVFAALAARDKIPLSGVTAVCISPATAAALAGGAFAAIRIAARPNQEALLACLFG
jgi:uroporphyrinogen-III synthase